MEAAQEARPTIPSPYSLAPVAGLGIKAAELVDEAAELSYFTA